MATATAPDLKNLSLDDLRDKLAEATKGVTALADLETRGPDEEADLVDKLDEVEQIQNALVLKNKAETDRRIANIKKFDAPRDRKTTNTPPVEGFSCLGERLHAVAQFRLTGQIDPKFRNALGANEGTPSDGGFLVGADFETDLQSKVYGDSQILNRIPRTPISSGSNMLKLRLLKEDSRADGSRQGSVRAYWEGEGQSVAASRQLYEDLELTLRKLTAMSYASSELLEDWSALEAEMSTGYQEEMTFKLEDGVVNGDGVGKPLGILNSPAKVTVNAEVGQTATTPLMYENICAMWARLHPRSQMSAIWLLDQSLWPYLMTMGITNGITGTPVYLPPNGAADAPFGTLFGRPVVSTEYTQVANTEGDIVLWDPQGYRMIEKGGMKGVSSIHVAFLTDETAFRFIYRANGAPKWRTPLTPKNGGPTLSNIVTLATRT